MSEEVTNSEETTVPETAPTPPKKAVAKKPAKKADKKPAKKPAKAAKKAKAAKAPKNPPKDNARKVAKASEGKLTTDQVRILRALRKGRPCTMQVVKVGCHIPAEAKYSGSFLKAMHNLRETRRVKVEEGQEKGLHTFTITERGKSDLEKAEAAAK